MRAYLAALRDPVFWWQLLANLARRALELAERRLDERRGHEIDIVAAAAVLVTDEQTYRNYKYNRLHSPNTSPSQWRAIYGAERVRKMEKRFQLDPDVRRGVA